MNSEEVLQTVIEVIEEITEDWDLEEIGLGADSRLSADLGFSSVDVVQLFASLSARFQRKFRYDRLIVDEGGQYRDELSIGEIATYLENEMTRGEG
tara:strand:+ start:14705 stop:14992 length:288 start_codon:yes stop_codon:yes gene_type:complete